MSRDDLVEYELTSARGVRARVLNLGAALTSLVVPDRNGKPGEILLGFDDPARYRGPHPHMGSSIGRCANRLAHGRFSLAGRDYQVPRNAGAHHLHGGENGFHRVLWRGERTDDGGVQGVVFRHTSPDGDEGYPGELDVTTNISLADDGALSIAFSATTDATTLVNLTHHGYFNLADGGSSSVLDHELVLAADHYTPTGPGHIPTGEIAPVAGTPFDFTVLRRIGERIGEVPGGYDHNYALRGAGQLALAARVREPSTGRTLELHTTAPGLQVYTGNSLDGSCVGRSGVAYRKHGALCLEPQRFPDAPHHPSFPSVVLEPGDRFELLIVYRFPSA